MNSIFGPRTNHSSSRSQQRRSRLAKRRRLASESLENRVLLAGDTVAWHNASMPLDTNGDERVTSIDALVVINELNRNGAYEIDASLPAPGFVDVDNNGFVTAADALQIMNFLNEGQGEDHFKVQVRVAVTGVDSLDPVDTLNAGDEFLLRVFVTDITDAGLGVFAAYTDVTYNAELADVNGDIQHCVDSSNVPLSCLPTEFPNGITNPQDPDSVNFTGVDGVLDEVGGFSSSLTPTGPDERLLLSVPMIAENVSGTLTFSGDPSDILPAHEINLFGEDVGVLNDEIMYVNTSVQIVSDAVPPVAANDLYDAVEDTELVVDAAAGVLANDTPATGVTVQLVSDVANGTLTLNDDGSFSYAPGDNFNGSDSFSYITTDGALNSNVATVTLNVAAVNDAPVAVDDAYSTPEGVTLALLTDDVGWLINDFDVDGDEFTVAEMPGEIVAENGFLTFSPGGGFAYIPNDGFTGTDQFTYTITDGDLTSEPATVTITVVPDGGNEAPVANDDAYEIDEDMTLTVEAPGVLANDTDGDDDPLTVSLVTGTTNGTVTLDEDGGFTYVPDADFNGTDTFTYAASDGVDSDTATVTITVISVNDPPVANDESYSTPFETALVTTALDGVLANDSDAEGPVTALVVVEPNHGVLEFESDGSFVYTPDDGFAGTDSFMYAVQDSGMVPITRFATATIEVLPAMDDLLVAFRVATTDLGGDELTSIDIGDPFLLNVFVDDITSGTQQGVFAAYTDVTWDDSLAAVTGAITYNPVYPNGQSGNASTPGLIDEAGAFDGLTPLGGDEQLLFQVPMVATAAGQLTFATDPADDLPFGDVLLFITRENAVDPEDIDYGSTTLTVLGPSEPVAVDDSYDADGGSVIIEDPADGILANDVTTGGTLTAALVDGPANGTLTLEADGTFAYVADIGFVGIDTFTYTATSDDITSEPGTVSITVGELEPGTISGSVYFDTNNNGIREGELAFGGLTVTLTGTDAFGQAVERVTATNADGFYSFANVVPGNYVVTETQPAIVIDGIDAIEGLVSATNDSHTIALSSGESIDNVDFGERGLQPAYFGNPLFFTSAARGGARVGLAPGGQTSWFCFDSGWNGYTSLQVSVSGEVVTITAQTLNGTTFVGTASTSDRNVQVIGTEANGQLVRLTGAASDYNLLPAAGEPAAIDAVFAS